MVCFFVAGSLNDDIEIKIFRNENDGRFPGLVTVLIELDLYLKLQGNGVLRANANMIITKKKPFSWNSPHIAYIANGSVLYTG